ncbi:MAG: hypothetical protein QOI40_3477 [Alphaproteobacteria bacterium]|nr:hypothetical protein [Alphaproteobacteria bacterium]
MSTSVPTSSINRSCFAFSSRQIRLRVTGSHLARAMLTAGIRNLHEPYNGSLSASVRISSEVFRFGICKHSVRSMPRHSPVDVYSASSGDTSNDAPDPCLHRHSALHGLDGGVRSTGVALEAANREAAQRGASSARSSARSPARAKCLRHMPDHGEPLHASLPSKSVPDRGLPLSYGVPEWVELVQRRGSGRAKAKGIRGRRGHAHAAGAPRRDSRPATRVPASAGPL